MFRPLHIALLETKRFLLDRGDLAFSLALPVVLFALMYGTFGGGESFNGTAHFVDLDGGPAAKLLVESLSDIDGIDVEMHSLEDADQGLDRSSFLSVAVIPEGFSEALDDGEQTSLTFRQRGSGGNESQIINGIIRAITQEMAGEAQVYSVVREVIGESSLPASQVNQAVFTSLAEAHQSPSVVVRSIDVGGASAEVLHRLLPGILVMFLLFAVSLGSQALVEERRIGTLERLLTTRLSLNQLFAGRFLAGVSRAMVQAVVLLGLAFVVLQVGGASVFVQTLIFCVLVAAAVSAVSLLIGTLARSRDQATWSAVFFTMFMTVFGGTFFEVGNTGALAFLSKFTINKYAIDALEGLVSGAEGLSTQGPEAAIIAGVAVASLLFARLAFRTGVGGR
ncbi:MAG: ABC-type multidrug transport system, permease component [Chloroflexi bacterium]|jgi:ABC-2 type transport system permease protein|nr:MAG: ABC-type multidrug transport system, permease component [Chloroflexota bacterium]